MVVFLFFVFLLVNAVVWLYLVSGYFCIFVFFGVGLFFFVKEGRKKWFFFLF